MVDYTIIVPTHDRHSSMSRSIKYFSAVGAEVIYVDSSLNPYLDRLPNNIRYFHCPEMKFAQKALYAIRKCNGKYIAFCADDDFIINKAIRAGIGRLESNKILVASVGRYLAFNKQYNGQLFDIRNYDGWPNVEGSGNQNIVNFLSNYHQIMWALYRRATIEQAYTIISEVEFSNDNFIELVIATVCAGTGGIAFVDKYWGVREINSGDHWAKRCSSICPDKDSCDIAKFICGLSSVVGRGNAELAIGCYLKSQKNKYSNTKNKKYISKVVSSISKKIMRRAVVYYPSLRPVVNILKVG